FAAFAFDFDEQGRLVLRKNASVSTLIGLMRPAYRGRISLRSADPLAPPVIEHQQLSCDDDIEQIVEGIGIARDILKQSPVMQYIDGEMRPGPEANTPEDLRAYVKMAAIPMYHPV